MFFLFIHLSSPLLFSFPRHQWVEKQSQVQGQKLNGFRITELILYGLKCTSWQEKILPFRDVDAFIEQVVT